MTFRDAAALPYIAAPSSAASSFIEWLFDVDTFVEQIATERRTQQGLGNGWSPLVAA